MKTLDEVLSALDGCFLKNRKEWCIENCPYLQNDEQMCRRDVLNDALHYLEEYKGLSEMWNNRLDAEQKNNPLTWDELKQMEGKPVWVELNSEYGNYSHWGIIHSFPKAGYEFMELLGFHDIVFFSVMQKEQGKTWNAYRKERTE